MIIKRQKSRIIRIIISALTIVLLTGIVVKTEASSDSSFELTIESAWPSIIITCEGVTNEEGEGYNDGYEIYRSSSKNGTYKLVKNCKGNNISYKDRKGLKFNKKYYYKIRAYHTDGEKSVLGTVKTISVKCILETPICDVGRIGQNNIIRWNKVNGADGYSIYMYDEKKQKYVWQLNKGAAARMAKHKNIKNGKMYKYKIRAYKCVGGKKIYSGYSGYKNSGYMENNGESIEVQLKNIVNNMYLYLYDTERDKKKVITVLDDGAVDKIKALGYKVKYKFYESTDRKSKYYVKETTDKNCCDLPVRKNDKRLYYKVKIQIYSQQDSFIGNTMLEQSTYISIK